MAFLKFGTCLCLLAGLAMAERWSGTLLDATCYDLSKPQIEKSAPGPETAPTCVPTEKSTLFALRSQGKVFKFDAPSSAKAAGILKGMEVKSKQVEVDVSGQVTGETLHADSIQLNPSMSEKEKAK